MSKIADIVLHNQIMRAIEAYMDSRIILLHGIIDEYDSPSHSVRVRMLPQLGDVPELTGFIPLIAPWVGSGWGAKFAPGLGTQTLIAALGHPPEALFAFCPFFDRQNKPPAADTATTVGEGGEFVLHHKSGTHIRLNNDSSVLISQAKGAMIDIHSDGSITIHSGSTVLVEAQHVDLGGSGGLALLNTSAMDKYNMHSHGMLGTSTPHPPMVPTTDATTITKAK